MSKRKHDKSNVSTPAGASQFKAHATRQTLAYDAYGARTTFIVRVLTRPIPMSADDFKTVMAASDADSAIWEVDATAATRIVFMGRILQDEMDAPSPHSTLPDPCQDWTIKTKGGVQPGCAAKIVSWHTRFFSRSDYNGKVPGIGDKVRVTLSTGDFKYNLQNAYFETLESVELADSDESCQSSLEALFKGFDHTQLGEVYDISSEVAKRSKKKGDCHKPGPPYTSAVAASPTANHSTAAHVSFFKKMRAALPTSKFSDEFIYGMMGNVAHESNFKPTISGDPECKEPARMMKGWGYSGGKMGERTTLYAAHGFFQMNTCRAGAMGRQMLAYHGITTMPEQASDKAYKILTSGDNQIKFMAWRLQKYGGSFTDTGTAAIAKYTDWFLLKVENPGCPAGSRKSRTDHALGYAASIPPKL